MDQKTYVVAFDDVALQLGDTGIARYWRELLESLIEHEILEKLGIRPIFVSRSEYRTSLIKSHVEFSKYNFQNPAADRKLISALCDYENVDLFVSSYYTFSTSTPNMSLIYDLIPEVFGFNRMNRGWMERELAINASSSFFSISQNTKKDLHKFYPHTRELLTGVGYPGIDVELFSQKKVFLQKKDNSEKRYFVCVGSRYGEGGYKNGKLLVDALTLIDSSKMDFNLYFVGGESLTAEEIKLQKRKELQIFTGRLGDEELVSVLSNAEALIYPSKYEGFGMPPLEALALGTPVIVTKNSSILESVGDLGIFVENNEPYKLAEILSNTDFGKVREELKIDGPKRAAIYSWERTANDFGEALQQTLTTPQSDSVLKRKNILSEYSEIAINLQR